MKIYKYHDCLGEKYNKLTVIKKLDSFYNDGGKKIEWLCKCDCGNETITTYGNLKTDRTKSCGCIKYNFVELTDEARDFLDGILLGDGNYSFNCKKAKKSVKMKFNQISKHSDWTFYIKNELEKFNIKSKIYTVPVTSRFFKKENRIITTNELLSLETIGYIDLKKERLRWYPNDIKIIPKDINLMSGQLLAGWYMGDGSLANFTTRHRCIFYTNCFTEDDVNWLKSEFYNKLNINATISCLKKKYFILNISQKTSITIFIDKIRPFIVDSFLYKLP